VDPLCGTANYAAALPLCAVNVALVEDHNVTLAVIGDGSTGRVYVAERGGGAWRLTTAGADRLRVSDASGLISIDPRGGGPGALRTFGREFATYLPILLDRGWDVRMLGTSLVLAYLAAGGLAAAVCAQDGRCADRCS
jgi:myo-inositol-1(or 4)-monophosphatase